MAHELDFSRNEKGAFVAYQEKAWHNLGTVFNRDLTVKECLNEGGLDYHVVKLPNIHRYADNAGNDTDIVSKTSFFSMRTDTNAVLGSTLGCDYTVYQNIDALQIVDDLVATGKCKIETAGAIKGGKVVFICLKIDWGIKVADTDTVFQYCLLTNSHDGSLSITAMLTNVRVVCNNTLCAALAGAKSAYKIRHTKNAQDRVKEAFQIMGLIDSNEKKNLAAYNAMAANKLSQFALVDYIGNIFLTDAEIKECQKGTKAAEVLSTRKQNILTEIFDFAEGGIGQKEAFNLTGSYNMWYAYNAVTGYLSGKKYGSADDRFSSLLLGDSSLKIKAAGELALHPDKIQPLRASGSGIIGLSNMN